jgi:hypothetical protein
MIASVVTEIPVQDYVVFAEHKAVSAGLSCLIRADLLFWPDDRQLLSVGERGRFGARLVQHKSGWIPVQHPNDECRWLPVVGIKFNKVLASAPVI